MTLQRNLGRFINEDEYENDDEDDDDDDDEDNPYMSKIPL